MFCTSQHAKIREAILVPKHWKFCCILLNTTLKDFVWYEITQNLAVSYEAPWLTAEQTQQSICTGRFSSQWLQCCQCIPGMQKYMEATVSDEEKHAVPNAPEKLFKNSSLHKNNSKEAVSAQLCSFAGICVLCPAHLASPCTPRNKPSGSKWGISVHPLICPFIWLFGLPDFSQCRTEIILIEIVWENIVCSPENHTWDLYGGTCTSSPRYELCCKQQLQA